MSFGNAIEFQVMTLFQVHCFVIVNWLDFTVKCKLNHDEQFNRFSFILTKIVPILFILYVFDGWIEHEESNWFICAVLKHFNFYTWNEKEKKKISNNIILQHSQRWSPIRSAFKRNIERIVQPDAERTFTTIQITTDGRRCIWFNRKNFRIPKQQLLLQVSSET